MNIAFEPSGKLCNLIAKQNKFLRVISVTGFIKSDQLDELLVLL